MPPRWLASAEQVVGAQPGLHVLERDVVDLLAARERMPHLGEHQRGRVANVDLGERHSERLAQRDRVALGALAGGEAGQGEGEDVAARPAFAVHRAGRDDQRVGRVQATGDADHDLGIVRAPAAAAPAPRPGCCRPRSNPVAAVADPTARTGSARPRGAARCHPSAGRRRTRSGGTRRCVHAWCLRLSSNVPIRIRSARSRSVSTSATERRSPLGKRSDSASRTPFS